jgi:hypothetical protein
MSTTALAGSLLGRRLDRLRDTGGRRPIPAPVRPAAHSAALARALGGSVDGPIALFESHHDVPIDRSALARLPVPIDRHRPLVCLDLETTGLATGPGTLAFLVGLGWWHGDRLIVRQLLLPDHVDEPQMLSMLAQLIPADGALVTYNGRCFDWPLLAARYRLHRRDPPAHADHHDLLPVARQLWRPRLGDARLATVERGVCGVERDDDLPGALIPERYFAYLRDRRPEPLRAVLDHNRQDIATLGRLLGVLGRLVGARESWSEVDPSDLGGLGRALARHGRPGEALGCVEAALTSPAWRRGIVGGGSLWRRLATDRARLLARLGQREEAIAAWLDIGRRGGPGAAGAWLHVARHREWVERDYSGAIEACNQALAATERARMWGRPVPSVERDLAARLPRLRRRGLRAGLSRSSLTRSEVPRRAA